MTTAQASPASTNDSSSPSLKDLVQAKKAQLEAQLKALDGANIDKLLQEREALAAKLRDVDTKITEVRSQLGLPAANGTKQRAPRAATGTRPRMNSQEIRNRILKALSSEKHGLSQKTISDRTEIPYGTVAAFMKKNPENFKSTGQLKSKRYFLR